jgi:hypothetical protein
VGNDGLKPTIYLTRAAYGIMHKICRY